jgi:hypothetical protein
MAKTKVFAVFDYDNDETLKEFLFGQSKLKDSPFCLSDWSIKEPLTGDWKEKARKRIKAADVVAVICGLHTDTAAGVSAEVTIAQEEKKEYFLLAGYPEKNKRPNTARDSDKLYRWTWDVLKTLIRGGR